MHVVHLIARLNDGGPARVVASLARALSARGHRVSVLAGRCQDGERDLSPELRQGGVEVETISHLGRRLDPLADARSMAAVIARLADLRPALVHSHTAKAGTLARLACRWLDLPCLHTYHGHVLRGYFARAPAMAAWLCERLIAGTAHHQALTTGQLEELAVRLGIGRRRRWHCLPIPVEIPRKAAAPWQQRLQPGVPVVGFLGRFAAVKDPLLWLEAVARIGRRRSVQGLMCGDGALRAAAEARAAALGVHVLFTGFVPAGEALAVCDVLLLTSRNEGSRWPRSRRAGWGCRWRHPRWAGSPTSSAGGRGGRGAHPAGPRPGLPGPARRPRPAPPAHPGGFRAGAQPGAGDAGPGLRGAVSCDHSGRDLTWLGPSACSSSAPERCCSRPAWPGPSSSRSSPRPAPMTS